MKQENAVKFESEDKKITLLCSADVCLGSLHDFLLACKGAIVDRMVAAQKAENEAANQQKDLDKEEQPQE